MTSPRSISELNLGDRATEEGREAHSSASGPPPTERIGRRRERPRGDFSLRPPSLAAAQFRFIDSGAASQNRFGATAKSAQRSLHSGGMHGKNALEQATPTGILADNSLSLNLRREQVDRIDDNRHEEGTSASHWTGVPPFVLFRGSSCARTSSRVTPLRRAVVRRPLFLVSSAAGVIGAAYEFTNHDYQTDALSSFPVCAGRCDFWFCCTSISSPRGSKRSYRRSIRTGALLRGLRNGNIVGRFHRYFYFPLVVISRSPSLSSFTAGRSPRRED